VGPASCTAAPSRHSATSPPTRPSQRSTSRTGREAERRARLHYRLRGYRIVAANAWAGGYELDLVVRRGRRLVFCEVKAKTGGLYGDPLEMIGAEKLRRLERAAETWISGRTDCAGLEIAFEAVGIRAGRVRRVPLLP
jgi:putative endonuclease